METKLDHVHMEFVRCKCGFYRGIEVPAKGTKGSGYGLEIGYHGGPTKLLSLHIDVQTHDINGGELVVHRTLWLS